MDTTILMPIRQSALRHSRTYPMGQHMGARYYVLFAVNLEPATKVASLLYSYLRCKQLRVQSRNMYHSQAVTQQIP